MELHHILVPTDFSVYAEQALQEALMLTVREHAQLLLLHVLPRCEWMWTDMPRPTHLQLMQDLQTDAEQRLQTVAAHQRWPIETVVVWGDPATEICRIAQAYETDLIVMGTHGRTGLARLFRGSVAEHVVRAAPCAVLIVRTYPARAAQVAQSPVLRSLHRYSPREAAWSACVLD